MEPMSKSLQYALLTKTNLSGADLVEICGDGPKNLSDYYKLAFVAADQEAQNAGYLGNSSQVKDVLAWPRLVVSDGYDKTRRRLLIKEYINSVIVIYYWATALSINGFEAASFMVT